MEETEAALVHVADDEFAPLKLEWTREQDRLKERMVVTDELSFRWGTLSDTGIAGFEGLRHIGGVDISFSEEDESKACAALVVLSYPDMEVVYEDNMFVQLTLPFISGFLAFREGPALCALVERLRTRHPELEPQVLFTDGNGTLHPRGFGVACHLGVILNIPTIGIGKTFHHVDGLTVPIVKSLSLRNKKAGDFVLLQGDSGVIWGAALQCADSVKNPVFVSTGHRVSLDTAIKLTMACSKYRVPEPTRQADIRSREYLRKNPWHLPPS